MKFNQNLRVMSLKREMYDNELLLIGTSTLHYFVSFFSSLSLFAERVDTFEKNCCQFIGQYSRIFFICAVPSDPVTSLAKSQYNIIFSSYYQREMLHASTWKKLRSRNQKWILYFSRVRFSFNFVQGKNNISNLSFYWCDEERKKKKAYAAA